MALAYLTGVHQLPDMPIWMAHQEAELARAKEAVNKRSTEERSGLIQRPDGRSFVAKRET